MRNLRLLLAFISLSVAYSWNLDRSQKHGFSALIRLCKMSLLHLEIPTWHRFCLLSLLSVGVLLQYSGFILGQIPFRGRAEPRWPVTVEGRLHMPLFLTAAHSTAENVCIKPSSHSNIMKTPAGAPLSLCALSLLHTHRASDLWKWSWSFKHELCSASP